MGAATIVLIVVIAVILVVAILAVVGLTRRRRRARLQERFGPEWNRVVDTTGSARAAETELNGRAERREDLDIRSLQRRHATATNNSGVKSRASSWTSPPLP